MLTRSLPLLTLTSSLVLGGVATTSGSETPADTYTGRVGKAEVVACLDEAGTGGRYYYLKHGKTLELTADESREGSWVEREPSHPFGDDDEQPSWHLTSVAPRSDGALDATWEPPAEARKKGRNSLPIHLQRAARGCEEFERRRTEVPKIVVQVPAPAAPYFELRRHGLAQVAHLRLLGGAPANVIASINRRLDEIFQQAVAESWDCSDHELEVEAEIYPQELLIADFSGGSYCGGPHPNEGYIVLAIDLRDGEQVSSEVAAEKWFGGLPDDFSHTEGGLAAFLAAEIDPAECREEIGAQVYWPTPGGVVFRLWTDTRFGASCRQDIVLPWGRAVDFALPAARPLVAAWQKRLAGRQPIVASSTRP